MTRSAEETRNAILAFLVAIPASAIVVAATLGLTSFVI